MSKLRITLTSNNTDQPIRPTARISPCRKGMRSQSPRDPAGSNGGKSCGSLTHGSMSYGSMSHGAGTHGSQSYGSKTHGAKA